MMNKNPRFYVAVLMLLLGAGGVGFTAATVASADIAASNDGMISEKPGTVPAAEPLTVDNQTGLQLNDGSSKGDRVKDGGQAGLSPDGDALSRSAGCPISLYVSTTGSDGIGHGSNDCLDASSPCRTIRHAIDTSSGKKECPVVIHVAAGTYDEHVTMNSWESLDGGWNRSFSRQWDFENDGIEPTAAYTTIIDGEDSGTCITQNSLSGANINGLTIKNGRGRAGGIYLDHSHPAITNCTIKENYGESSALEVIRSAGGLYNYYSNPTVENCAFSSNDCQGAEDYMHASAVLNAYSQAIFINSSFSETMLRDIIFLKGIGMVNSNSSPTIDKCRFENNSGYMFATGPLVNFDSSVMVTDSIFSGNYLGESGPAAIENNRSTVTIINCQFLGNRTSQCDAPTTVGNYSSSCIIMNSIFAGNISSNSSYGQIFTNHDSECTIVNSTFADNLFEHVYDLGAVIMNEEDSHCIIKNSIIWGSRQDELTGAVVALDTDASSTLEAGHSDIDQDGFEGSDGNIRLDPQFVATGWDDNGTPDNMSDDIWVGGDYHLRTGSPCIDSGTQVGVALEDTDFEGDPRIMDGDNDGVAQVDMGADEAACFISTLMD